MSITDELRDCIRTADRSYEDTRNPCNDREILYIPEEELLAIADRIDAEHRKALERVAAMVDEPSPDALERRIDRLDGMLDGMGKGAASRIEAIECRVSAIERKLNHKVM